VRVAIVGGSGFIGKNLRLHFEEVADRLVVVDRENLEPLDDIDVLIHAGWAKSRKPERFNPLAQQVNVDFAERLAEVIRVSKIPCVVGLGSQAEYVESEKLWSDDSAVEGLDAYSDAKIKVRKILEGSTERLLWMRLFSVYGWYDRNDWILRQVVSGVMENKQVNLGSCENFWSFTHIDDVVSGIDAAIRSDLDGSFLVTNTISKKLKYWLLDAARILGDDGSLLNFTDTGKGRNVEGIPEKLLRIGWKPRISFDAGVVDFAGWLARGG
jgi:nucleoside-diphosphate-sugar epimerase